MVAILRGDGHPVGAVLAADPGEIQGVNNRVQLAQVRRAYNDRLLEAWMWANVPIVVSKLRATSTFCTGPWSI